MNRLKPYVPLMFWYAIIPCLLTFVLVPASFASETQTNHDWKLRKQADGIKVYTRRVSGSMFKAVKGQMRVKASINSLVAVIQDTESCSRWADRCKESKVIETISDTEYYLYAYNNIPFPAKDRDIVAHIRWSYSADSGEVVMQGKAVSGRHPKTKAIRVENAHAQWHFSPQADGYTLVENMSHADPGGAIPVWIANMMVTNSPFKTMSKIKTLVEAGEYADHVIPFLPTE